MAAGEGGRDIYGQFRRARISWIGGRKFPDENLAARKEIKKTGGGGFQIAGAEVDWRSGGGNHDNYLGIDKDAGEASDDINEQ